MALASEPEDQQPGIIGRIDRTFDRLINGWNPYHPDKLGNRGLDPVEIEESKVRRGGSRVIIIAMVAFFVWAVAAPIDQGVTMQGTVTIAGYRKAVQHPNGGIVSKVLVSEGDQVKQGQVLLRINPLQTAAEVSNLEQEYINLLVSESRAKAELLDRPIVWDPDLNKFNPREVFEAKQIQQRLYSARQAQFAEQMKGLSAQINGLRGTVSSHSVQLDTLNQELGNTRELASQGFVPKQQVNVTLRNKVDQEAALNSARSDIGKIQAQIAAARSEQQNEAAKELADIQKNREAISSKLEAAQFNQSLSEIRAPIDGTVVNLKVFTEGGVIRGGDVLMEIVPSHGTLIVDTKVTPSAIDRVHVGQDCDLRFTSFNSSRTPVVGGRVKSVGVDKQKAEPGQEVQEKEDYYLAQVETTPEALAALGNRQLRPGMPVDVIVKGGQRTFMAYLLKPLTDKLSRAFKD
jgi:membrane fusion protein, protease secretion system